MMQVIYLRIIIWLGHCHWFPFNANQLFDFPNLEEDLPWAMGHGPWAMGHGALYIIQF
jgi:hypothetical protein